MSDYLSAKLVLCRQTRIIQIDLVGCGGTGSYLAPRLADIATLLIGQGKEVRLRFIDPDRVEARNIPRQGFVKAEISLFKADALAYRYSLARGIEIAALPTTFADALQAGQYRYHSNILWLIVGCVDNAAARQSIHDAIVHTAPDPFQSYYPAIWWLDCGNERYTGQVLLGNTADPAHLTRAFELPDYCAALPLPSLQHPELLVPQSSAPLPTHRSCAERLLADEQSLLINHRVAIEAADMIAQLLLTRSLRRYATYVDSLAGTTTSRYTTHKEG